MRTVALRSEWWHSSAYFAGVVKLVDTLDLGSSAERHGGSSPSARTTNDQPAEPPERDGKSLLSEPKNFGPQP